LDSTPHKFVREANVTPGAKHRLTGYNRLLRAGENMRKPGESILFMAVAPQPRGECIEAEMSVGNDVPFK
jgi:hypothetical protein